MKITKEMLDKPVGHPDSPIPLMAPRLWKLAYPRRYATPHGYTNPRINSLNIIATCFDKESLKGMENQIASTTISSRIITAWTLIECGMPLYFVDYDFISDLTDSEPPADMKLAELEWPFEAITFALPEKFQLEYFGCKVPFINIARRRCGNIETPKSILDADYRASNYVFQVGSHCEEMFMVNSTVEIGVMTYDYSSNWKMSHQIDTVFNHSGFFSSVEGDTPEQNASDSLLSRKMMNVAVLMLMSMMAMPDDIEPEVCTRPQKIKHNIVKEALWSPRYLGRKYGSRRKAWQGGTHASPRVHPRKAHWRKQACVPGRTKRVMRLIKWRMVGTKEVEEEA